MKTEKAIFVKQRQSVFAIQFDNIVFMEKTNRKITVHVVEGEDICFYGKYDSLMSILDERFVHPHESYVINMQYIHRLGNKTAVMFDGQIIKMGGRCFGRLKRAYEDYIRNHISSRTEAFPAR